LEGNHYSHRQALLYIDPQSLDLIFRDYSNYGTTRLLFGDPSESGIWRATNDTVIEQAILPSSNALLAICEAHFTFRWYPPSEEREIRAAKEAFILRDISEDRRRTPVPPDGPRLPRWT
jgi:hypothetical protein